MVARPRARALPVLLLTAILVTPAVLAQVGDAGGGGSGGGGDGGGSVSASFSIVCTDLNCTFDASASHAMWPTYAWTFGDGETHTTQQAITQHAYAEPGTFTVTLTVEEGGASDTARETIILGDLCTGVSAAHTNVSVTPDEPDGAANWYVTAPTLAFTTNPGNLTVWYRWDRGTWSNTSTGAPEHPGGARTLEYCAEAADGSMGASGTLDLAYDGEEPDLVRQISPRRNSHHNTSNLTLELLRVPADRPEDGSGIDRVLVDVYRNDTLVSEDHRWDVDREITVTGDGTYTLHVETVDKAGNARTQTTGTWTVDTRAPELELKRLDGAPAGILAVEVTADERLAETFDHFDPQRGVVFKPKLTVTAEHPNGTTHDLTLIKLGASRWLASAEVDEAGPWWVNATALDDADNTGTASLRLDPASPAATLDLTDLTPADRSTVRSYTDEVRLRATLGSEAANATVSLRTLSLHPDTSNRAREHAPTGLEQLEDGSQVAWWNLTANPGVLAFTVEAAPSEGAPLVSRAHALPLRDDAAPELMFVTPADGATLTDPRPTIGAFLHDATGLDPAATQLILVEPGSVSAGTVEGAHRQRSSILYEPSHNLAPGTYEVTLKAADAAGNQAPDHTWTFTLTQAGSGGGTSGGDADDPYAPCEGQQDCVRDSGDASTNGSNPGAGSGSGGDDAAGAEDDDAPPVDATPPVLLDHGPRGLVDTARPTIHARYADNESNITVASLRVWLNGEPLPVTGTSDGFEHRVNALEPGVHTVRIQVDDGWANPLRAEWTFRALLPSTPGDRAVAFLPDASADDALAFTFDDPHLRVQAATLQLAEAAENLTAWVQRTGSLPLEAPTPPLDVHHLVTLDASADGPVNATAAGITFTATPGHLENLDITPEQVRLLHWDGTRWHVLDTRADTPNANNTTLAFHATGPGPGLYAFAGDNEAPRLTFVSPPAETATREVPDVRLHATDALGVADVTLTLNEKTVALTATGGENGAFDATLGELPDGLHVLVATATDAAGNMAETRVSFLLDREPPVFPGRSPSEPVTDRRPTLHVYYVDNGTGVDASTVRVYFDDRDVTEHVTRDADGVAYRPNAPLDPGTHTLRITVQDKAGNEASHGATFQLDLEAPGVPGLAVLAAVAGAAMVWGRRGRR